MKWLVAAQMAFCVFVLFVAVLFAATLRGSSTCHSASRTTTCSSSTQTFPESRSRQRRGRGSSIDCADPRVSSPRRSRDGRSYREADGAADVFVPGRPPETRPAYLLEISPRFFETLNIPFIGGRDFRPGDVAPTVDKQNLPAAGVAIVNQAFARVYFDGGNPVGRQVAVRPRNVVEVPVQIVGLVADSVYSQVREPMHPTMFFPSGARSNGTLSVRTAGDPLMFASTLRQIVAGTSLVRGSGSAG